MRFSAENMLKPYILYDELVKVGLFGKVARKELHRAELRKAENVRFHKYGRGYIQPLAYIRKIFEKLRINYLIVPLVSHLLYDFFAYYYFTPKSEHIIIIL